MAKLTPEEKRRRKRLSERKRIESRKEKLRESGITSSITYKGKKYTPSQLAKASQDTFTKAIRSHKQKQKRIDDAQRYAKALGATPEQIKEVRTMSDVVPRKSQDRKVYSSDYYMSVMWANVSEDTDLRPFIEEAKRMTVDQMMSAVKRLYNQGSFNISGSDDLHGFFKFDQGTNYQELLDTCRVEVQKGYSTSLRAENGRFIKQLVNTQDVDMHHITLSNSFTAKGMASLLYVVMNNVKNSDKKAFYENVELFCKWHLPDLHKKLF